jgi:hypothetical protein
MREPLISSDHEDFQLELEILRSVIRRNVERLNQDPLLGKRLDFWMGSAQFMVRHLQILEGAGNPGVKYEQSMEQMQKVLHRLQKLVEELDDEGDSVP